MKMYLRDTRLWLFVLLTFGASIISSHGAFQFFKYLVDPWLAWVFILVVALGIIGLDVAGTIEQGRKAVAYYAGMGFFLILETLANYFAGQAGFVAQIVAKLPPSSDLRTIAETEPAWARILVVLFLSLASLAVAFFAFAATTRFQQVRSGMEGSIIAQLRRMLKARRERYARLADTLTQERAISAGTLENVRSQLETANAAANKYAHEIGKYAQEVEHLRRAIELEQDESRAADERSAILEANASKATQLAEERGDQLRTERETSARLRKDLDRKSAELEEMSAVLVLDVRGIAATLRDSDVSLRTIAGALGVSEKTIRNWTSEKIEA